MECRSLRNSADWFSSVFWFEYEQQPRFWPYLGGGSSDRDESSAESSVSSITTIPVLKSSSYHERTDGSSSRKLTGRFGSTKESGSDLGERGGGSGG